MNTSKASVLSFVFIALGLLLNPWVLGHLFAKDASIATLSDRIFIGILQFFLLFFGAFLYSQRAFLNKKRIFFSFIMMGIVITAVEGGLYFIHRVIHRVALIGDTENAQETDVNTFQDVQDARKTWNPPDFQKGKPDTIYVFGGSTLWGEGARDDYTIPSYLSKLLNHYHYPFIVHNYGEPAWDFKQEVGRLMSLLKQGHRPDFVIFYDGFNEVLEFAHSERVAPDLDFFEMDEARGETANANDRQIWVRVREFLANNSMIYMTTLHASLLFAPEETLFETFPLSHYSEEELQRLADRFANHYFESLRFLDALARDFNFRYIRFWQPVAFTEEKLMAEEIKTFRAINPLSEDSVLGRFFRTINGILRVKSFPHFFDISDVLHNRTRPYYTDWCHLSEEGNEVVALKMAEIFEREFLK